MTKHNKIYYSLRRLRLEKTLVFLLLGIIILINIVPKRFAARKPEHKSIYLRFTLVAVPATRQLVKRGRPRPRKPVVPIPVEDIEFPMDATIEETTIQWDIGDSLFGNAGITAGRADTIPPRPLMQVMPAYPEELRKQKVKGSVKLLVRIGRRGQVKDIVIAANSTGNQLCEKIAKEAAGRSKYVPAISRNKNIEMWTTLVYSFNPN